MKIRDQSGYMTGPWYRAWLRYGWILAFMPLALAWLIVWLAS